MYDAIQKFKDIKDVGVFEFGDEDVVRNPIITKILKNMMRIGIDINGVLRDTISKFTQLYEKHMIEKGIDEFIGQKYSLDISGNTELEETSVTPFEYKILSDVNSLDLINHFSFQNKEELFSFMYEDYTMELFGHAPSTEMTTFNILNDLYFDLRNKNELLIVSNEIGRSKPSSLFFYQNLVVC